jgi:hypothetical protein
MKHKAPPKRVVAVIIDAESIKVTHDSGASEIQTAADLLAAAIAVLPTNHTAIRTILSCTAPLITDAIRASGKQAAS